MLEPVCNDLSSEPLVSHHFSCFIISISVWPQHNTQLSGKVELTKLLSAIWHLHIRGSSIIVNAFQLLLLFHTFINKSKSFKEGRLLSLKYHLLWYHLIHPIFLFYSSHLNSAIYFKRFVYLIFQRMWPVLGWCHHNPIVCCGYSYVYLSQGMIMAGN